MLERDSKFPKMTLLVLNGLTYIKNNTQPKHPFSFKSACFRQQRLPKRDHKHYENCKILKSAQSRKGIPGTALLYVPEKACIFKFLLE
jgi:hypothetical protein